MLLNSRPSAPRTMRNPLASLRSRLVIVRCSYASALAWPLTAHPRRRFGVVHINQIAALVVLGAPFVAQPLLRRNPSHEQDNAYGHRDHDCEADCCYNARRYALLVVHEAQRIAFYPACVSMVDKTC
jgi:hypothetical protein